MAESDYKITLTRTGRMINGGPDEQGEISQLTVTADGKTATYYAMERRGGYVTLPPGSFTVKMEISPTHAGRQQFRVHGHHVWSKQHNRLAAILMHAGRVPSHVTGCIAPGKTLTSTGFLKGDSEKVLDAIFAQFHGFEFGKEAQLEVQGLAKP